MGSIYNKFLEWTPVAKTRLNFRMLCEHYRWQKESEIGQALLVCEARPYSGCLRTNPPTRSRSRDSTRIPLATSWGIP